VKISGKKSGCRKLQNNEIDTCFEEDALEIEPNELESVGHVHGHNLALGDQHWYLEGMIQLDETKGLGRTAFQGLDAPPFKFLTGNKEVW